MSSLVLGIHLGHHSACALVKNGELVAACQLERSSRTKYHPVLSLSNQLNLQSVLDQVGATIGDVDLIVTSFQATAAAGFGLDRPLIEDGFSLFDPWSDKHWVISHHLAHAHATFEASGFDDAAIIICDYAGSSTTDGADFALPFSEWYQTLIGHKSAFEPKTECMSLYRASKSAPYQVVHREYNIAHLGQSSFVYSVAGLYENVTQYVMRSQNAHGQLMALAAYGVDQLGLEHDPGPLVEVGKNNEVSFRNDWQHRVVQEPTFEQKACVAYRCQEATEAVLLAYARRAKSLVNSENLAVGGGVFLNILSNTVLSQKAPFSGYHVPSAPHDAGIAVGCAFFGARKLGEHSQSVKSDRLGPSYSEADFDAAFSRYEGFVTRRRYSDAEVLDALCEDNIVARFNGRSEFGPRALGGRSLLGNPGSSALKDRMNAIKGRQKWRPVAPIIAQERMHDFFDGPSDSLWMTKSQIIRPEHRSRLLALAHPDGSTRAQTLLEEQDPELYGWLMAMEARTGYPILINTSFNRRSEPIVERPEQALDMFLCRPDIDVLLVGPWWVERLDPFEVLADKSCRLGKNVFLTTMFGEQGPVFNVSNGGRTWKLSRALFLTLNQLGSEAMTLTAISSRCGDGEPPLPQLYEFLLHGIIEY